VSRKQINEAPRTKPKLRLADNNLVNDIHEDVHTGITHSHVYQPNRTKQLDGVKDIRNAAPSGPMEFLIPQEDYHYILPVTWPDLFHDDQEIRFNAWQRFKDHPDSYKYRTKDRVQKYFQGIGKL